MATYIKNARSINSLVRDLSSILYDIKEGEWERPIQELRALKASGREEEASKMKGDLPCFTISAEYSGARKPDNLTRYSGFVHLDYDKLDDPQEVKRRVEELPYTYSAFISPSGNGVKVIVPVDTGKENHTITFNAVKEYYDSAVGQKSDESVKDILRLCYVSYDPDLYLNEQAEKFILPKELGGSNTPNLEWVLNFTNAKVQFEEGSRNKFIFQFACNANRYGIDSKEVLSYCSSLTRPGFEWDEIQTTVQSAYQRNMGEHGTRTSTAVPAFTSVSSTSGEFTTPYVPESVYEALPDLLKEACSLFTKRERDVFFISCLSTISGALNINGSYRKDKVAPNLFTLIIANAASGKGVMKHARTLVQPFHDAIRKKSDAAHRQWLKKVALQKRKRKGADEGEEESCPRPLQRTYLIPGDVTTAKLLEHLEASNGYGCIFETESDSIGKNLRKEHSSYSDVMRKSYHNEPISLSRMDAARFSEVKEPRFSATISGTPGQFPGLVKSLEDGLLSRLLIYYYHQDPVWSQTYFEDDDNQMLQELERISIEVSALLENQVERTVVLTPEQGKMRDDWFSVIYPETVAMYGDHMTSVVTRLGVASQKIAMVLSAFRSKEQRIVLDDRDFQIGLTLVREVFLPHFIAFLKPMMKDVVKIKSTQLIDRFYERLPSEFNVEEIRGLVVDLQISERTRNDLFTQLIEQGKLERLKRGHYRKL